MSKNIFIATSEPYSGKSIISLGLVNMLLGKARKVGYFKPIINSDPKEKKDDHEKPERGPREEPSALLISLVDISNGNIRYLDKIVDELAKGKAMEKILRQPAAA